MDILKGTRRSLCESGCPPPLTSSTNGQELIAVVLAGESGRRNPCFRLTSAKRLGLERAAAWTTLVCAIFALAFMFAPSATAQVDEYRLKAAFLYNFTKFVDWPPETFKSPDEPITICILGSNPFGNILNETIGGKIVGTRSLTARQISDSQASQGCSIMFVSASEDNRFRAIVRSLEGCAVLSVGETDRFSAEGGIITFKLDHGSIRLEINATAAERAHVRISSKLLALAQVIRRAP